MKKVLIITGIIILSIIVVACHSNGALTAAYVAAYGGKNIAGVVLEDPPVFSTEGELWNTLLQSLRNELQTKNNRQKCRLFLFYCWSE